MTKFPILLKTAKKTKHPQTPPIKPLRPYEEMVGWGAIEDGYKGAFRGPRKYTREAVNYDLISEVNNVELWRELKAIEVKLKPVLEQPERKKQKEYTPGPYRHKMIKEPKERSLHIPQLRDKIVQLVIHDVLQDIYRPVFVENSYACLYGKGPIRAALAVQHDMRVARMKWGDEATVIKIDVRKFFYSIDRAILKKLLSALCLTASRRTPPRCGT